MLDRVLWEFLAQREGIEPPSLDLESKALPLDERRKDKGWLAWLGSNQRQAH